MRREWSYEDKLALVDIVCWALVIGAMAALMPGCGAVNDYAAKHPDVVQKAEMAVQVAQCVDDVVQRYQAANAAKVTITDVRVTPVDAGTGTGKLDPNPYMTWEQVTAPPPEPAAADGGTP